MRLLEKICDSDGGQKCEQREEQAAEPQPDVAVGSHGPESTLIGANSVPRYPELECLNLWTGRTSQTFRSPRC